MKKALVLVSVLLTVTLLFSGCSLIRSVLRPVLDSVFATPTPTAAPTPKPTPKPTPEPTTEPPAEEPAVEVTEEPASDPMSDITGVTWIAYEPLEDESWAVYEIEFLPGGDMTYMAGWYCSEIAYYGTGTWTLGASGSLDYDLTSSDGDMRGTMTFVLVNGDTLRLTHESGDSLNYVMKEEYGQEFVVKGSSMDQPPF